MIILLSAHCLTAQQGIDSLEHLLTESLADTQRVNVLNELSRELSFVQPSRATELLQQSLPLSLKLNYGRGAANAYRMLASLYAQEENNYLSAEYLERALEYFEANHDSVGIANCYITLGHIYRRQGNREEEIRYHKRSFEMFARLGIVERIAVTSHNLGESYFNNHDFPKAEYYTLYSIHLNDSIHNLTVLSSCYKVMGMLYVQMNRPDDAERYFNKVLDLSNALGKNSQKVATIESLIQLSRLAKAHGDRDRQINLLKQAVDIARANHLLVLVQTIYSEILRYYVQSNQQHYVLYYLNEFTAVNDSLLAQQQRDRSSLLKTAMEGFKLEREKERLIATTQKQDAEIHEQNLLLLIVGIIGLFLAGFIFLLKRVNSRVKATNRILIEQGAEIAEQKGQLEVLNSTKDKFFSIVAHDLRSPLASLKSYSMLIADHADTLTKEEFKSMGAQLADSVENTLKLTDNLITWARIQRGDISVNRQAVAIHPIVRDVFALYRAIAEAKNITLYNDVPPDIQAYADHDHVDFILRNLINNAIKFTKPGGSIRVQGTSTQSEIKITVTDTGVGMNEQMLRSLFTVGNRTTAGTGGEKGTGLGLTVCSEFAQKNNGILKALSKPGEGTTFIMILPAFKVAKAAGTT